MNKLGFGFLRLPQTRNRDIDLPLLERMVDRFLSSGGTYFDTAYTYLDGMSETALKQAVVERHPRASFQIADKLPGWMVRRHEDCERYFLEQCDRCGVDFFDVYLLHWLNRANYAIAERFNEFGFLERLKADGRIGKIGFSYHGDAATLEQVRDNMRDMAPLSPEESILLEKARDIISRNTAIPCTECRYCVKQCPKEIAIPDYFRIYNAYSRFPAEGWKMEPVYASLARNNGKASDCIRCRACERNCPQGIPITQWLKKVAEALEQANSTGTPLK